MCVGREWEWWTRKCRQGLTRRGSTPAHLSSPTADTRLPEAETGGSSLPLPPSPILPLPLRQAGDSGTASFSIWGEKVVERGDKGKEREIEGCEKREG